MSGKDEAVRREPRLWPWVRALVFAPPLLAALLVIAGRNGRTVIPLEMLHGGKAPLSMLIHDLAGLVALGAYLLGVLLAYALLVANPLRRQFARPGRHLGYAAMAILGGYMLLRWVQSVGDTEIAGAALRHETIAAGNWEAVACSRGKAICVRWDGSLGHASIKSLGDNRDAAQRDLEAWQRMRAQDAALEVEWGATPRGWIFPQAVRAGASSVRNPPAATR